NFASTTFSLVTKNAGKCPSISFWGGVCAMSDHTLFVFLAYCITTLTIGGVAGRILLDYRRVSLALHQINAERDDKESTR
ncbi:MAG: heme exporter protein CcmD, partial [Methylocystis sp.]